MSERFIQTDLGLINLRTVLSARRVKVTPTKYNCHHYRYRVLYAEGNETDSTYTDEDLAELTCPVVAALPGYFVVKVFGAAPDDVARVPIVAWRIDKDCALPICADDISGFPFGILDPTGTVTLPFAESFRSLEGYQKMRVDQLEHEAAEDIRRAAESCK